MTGARLLFCGALALLSFPAHGAPPAAHTVAGDRELSDLRGLLDEPVVSTASQSLELAKVAPATSVSIPAEDLRRFGIRSLDEAINFLGLGMVTQNPLHSVDIGARGVLLTADFGNHVLLLVNGHALNEQWDGTAYFERGAAIPFELIDHLEIILGPGSVLYGSNAMLGVINIITKRAKDWRGYHLVAESELPVSMRVALGVGRELTLFGHSGELTLALEYYAQSGPAFTFGPQQYGNDAVTMMPKRFDPSGRNAGVWGGVADRSYWTRMPSAYARLAVGHLALDVRAAQYKRGTPYLNQFNQGLGDFNDPEGWERDRWISADLKHHVLLSEIAELRSRLYADAYDYWQTSRISAAEDCLEGQTNGCVRRLIGTSRWAGLDEQVALDWRRDGRLVTLLGSDGRVRHAGTQIDDTDIVTGTNPGAIASSQRTEYAIGTYVQQTAQPVARLDLNAGARLDADQRFGTHLSPRAAVALRAWKGSVVKGIYAEAFRAPTYFELTYADPTGEPAASPLSPEVVRSLEVVLEQRLGTLRLLVGGFSSWWRDMVLLDSLTPGEIAAAIARGELRAGVTTAFQYRNASSIRNYGANAALEGSSLHGQLRYGATVTIARARRTLPDGTTVDLTVTPKVFGNARVSYDLPGDLPAFSLAALWVGRRLADRANDGMFMPTPAAPPMCQLRLTVAGAVPRLNGLSYRVTVDAATGKHSPYVAGPLQAATPEQPAAELAPIARFRIGVGLQYDFGAENR